MILRTLFLAAAVAAAASAAPAARHGLNAFVADYDADKDGAVTGAEFDAGRAARFAATDANKDGWVSRSEYLAEFLPRLDAQLATSSESAADKAARREQEVRQAPVRFGVLDSDRDARLSKAEYDASGGRVFAEQDKDGNGEVSAADPAVETTTR